MRSGSGSGSGRGCAPSEHLGTRGQSTDLAVELRVLRRGTVGGSVAAPGAGTPRASEGCLCTLSFPLRLLLEAGLFLVGLFHGLEAVGWVLGEVLGFFHVRHGLVVLPHLRSLILPHFGDEFGNIRLSAPGLAGGLRLLEDLHLCGAVEDPSIGRTRRSTVCGGTTHADKVDARVGEEVGGTGGTAGAVLKIGLDDVDVIERGRGG